ncbi:hypothetical protein KA183_18960 [bacterium]|nr:hypothetical protein [bacterium]QQR59861.1 MAG: hypothetical protein IPG59_10375 [Candidatus Melainabacteria bacterium]
MLKKNLLITICLLSLVPAASAASPAKTATANQAAVNEFTLESEKNLKILENRFFFHDYNHDPIEKRLERLELLVLGGVQFGNNKMRLERLKAMIQQKDSQAAKDLQARAKELKEQKEHKTDVGASIAESQYPVLNTLEWRALKKTYKGESLDKRLERLETNLFGVPATSMSYADRVDRLKKVIGIEQIQVNNNNSAQSQSAGPKPRAESQLPFDMRRMPMDGRSVIIEQFQQFPNGTPGPEFKDLADSTMRFRKLFDQMQKMMEMMPGMGTGMQTDIPPGFMQSFPFPIAPNGEPQLQQKFKPTETEEGTIPPYIDPNSI